MKFNKFTVAILGILTWTASLPAQDFFNTTIPLQVGTPGVAPAATVAVTNGPVDLVGYNQRADLVINTCTNGTGTATNTVSVQFSNDTTNWTALTSYALINSATSKAITNYWIYGNSNVVSQSYLLPYTITTPNASSSGYTTPYPAPLLFTNTASSISVTAKGTYIIGFNATDTPRYMQVIFNLAGTAATNGNTFISSTLFGNRAFNP